MSRVHGCHHRVHAAKPVTFRSFIHFFFWVKASKTCCKNTSNDLKFSKVNVLFIHCVLFKWMNEWKDEPEQGWVEKNNNKKKKTWRSGSLRQQVMRLCMFPQQRQHTLLINCDGILQHYVFMASCFGERIVVALGSPFLPLSLWNKVELCILAYCEIFISAKAWEGSLAGTLIQKNRADSPSGK